MQTIQLLYCALFSLLSLGSLPAQNEEKTESRSFWERIYAEGHFGALLADKIYDMSHVGAGYKITSRHYLGLEYIPAMRTSDLGNSWGVFDGWGVQYQHRFRKWYLTLSGGLMSEGHYATDGPYNYVPAEPSTPFSYFRMGTKHCFWGVFCLGCQYAQSGLYRGFAYDATGSVPPDDYAWEQRLRSLTLSFGLLLQKPPQLK
jgi:hypothetical protein